jgi:hypothetical protein
VARATRAAPRHLLLHCGLIGLAASVLASCVGGGSQPPPETAAVQPPAAPAKPRPPPRREIPRPARKPGPPAPIESAAPEAGAQAMAEPEPAVSAPGPPSTSPPHASELIGLDQPAATRLFGAAAERTEEPPATVWRYKTATCELDLFFYLDLLSGRMRTLHYAFKGDAADTIGAQDCLRSLFVARGS